MKDLINLPKRASAGSAVTSETTPNLIDSNLFQGGVPPGQTPAVSNGNGADMATIRAAQTRLQYPGGFPDVWPLEPAIANLIEADIKRGHTIVADFLADKNAQQFSEKEKEWEADAKAVLIANLGQPSADQFSIAASKGGSLSDDVDAKIGVLSKLVTQLRTTNTKRP
jgi:hypothetical protein